MKLLSALSPISILKRLFKGDEAATFQRLLVSQHVQDLRLIFQVTALAMIVVPVMALLICAWHISMGPPKSAFWSWTTAFTAMADLTAFIGAVWAVGCGVVAWTYQAGSTRLGVVDLFACEITTLCRVTGVVDAVRHLKTLGDHMPEEITQFSSEEEYFPVFASTVKDLQQLEEKVVKDVTAFYTYMKVMRDSMRKLADIKIKPADAGANEKWREAVGNVMYMLFLGLESARHSVDSLIEFQPTRAEEKIIILLSEIVAYDDLRKTVTDDLLRRRLQSREEDYHEVIAHLEHKVRKSHGKKWKSAKGLIGDLMKRYAQVFPIEEPAPVRELAMV